MFSRKPKLKRGLPLWMVDPDARWMVKQAERYSRHRRLLAFRLRGRQILNMVGGFFGLAVVVSVFSFVLANVSVWTYYHATPVSLIALFSQDEAALIGSIRKAGCVEVYRRYTMQGPNGEGRMSALNEYKKCAARSMDHPA